MDRPRTIRPTAPVADAPVEAQAVGRGALVAAGLAGLTYWAAGLATFPDGPTLSTATASQVRDHVARDGAAIQGAAAAGMVALAAGLVFVAALARQIRDRLPRSLLADAVLGAGLLVLVAQWLTVTAESVLRLLPHLLDSVALSAVDDRAVLTWYALGGFTHLLGDLAIVPTVALVAAFSVAARRGRLLPSWLVWVGLVVAVSGAVGMVGIVGELDVLYPFWFGALFGWFLWVLAVSVTFLLRLRRARPVEAA